MNNTFFTELKHCFETLGKDTSFRVIVLSANGKHFSVGLDLKSNSPISEHENKGEEPDVARKAFGMYNHLLAWQSSFNALEECIQPVIVCMHGASVGGPIDMACAADIRLCSKDAWFCIKEVDIGLAADLGTLQRIETVIGNKSLARELCYTARKMQSAEAKSAGFVSQVYETKEEMIEKAMDMAEIIASKSPVAIMSTKRNLLFSRDHTVKDSLKYQSIWNASMLQTKDTAKAAIASFQRQPPPEFSKL